MVHDGIHALVAAAQRGERHAVEALIREVIMPAARRACHKYAGQTPDPAVAVEDVVQIVVLAAVEALPRWNGTAGSLEGFVYGIARHKATDALRAAYRNRSVPVADMPEDTDEVDGPEHATLQAERAALARRLIATLPVRQQQILGLRLIHQLSAAETAARLGMTEGSVRVAQHRALTTLRARLDEQH
jgi:RNA polymerase sigma-70 factor (ECF subfamily)